MNKIFELKIKDQAFLLRALNHSLRKDMIRLMQKKGSITVTELYKRLNLEQSVASQHLAILRQANIVLTEKKGKFIFYSVNQPELDRINKMLD